MMKKRSDESKSKSESDADSSLGSDAPQSSNIKDHVSDFGGSSTAAEEPTTPEQEDLKKVPAPLLSTDSPYFGVRKKSFKPLNSLCNSTWLCPMKRTLQNAMALVLQIPKFSMKSSNLSLDNKPHCGLTTHNCNMLYCKLPS
jgi:hypothetical protein